MRTNSSLALIVWVGLLTVIFIYSINSGGMDLLDKLRMASAYPYPYPYPYPTPESTVSPIAITPTPPSTDGRFLPPTLNNPKVVVLTNEQPNYIGNGTEDIIVLVRERIARPVKISDVNNLVLVGGEFTIDTPLHADLPNTREAIARHRALAFANISGTAYLEGIWINNSGGGLSEGIQFWGSSGTLLVRNSRIEGVRNKPGDPDFNFNHPDLIQIMNGNLAMERVTLVDSDYQGMFIGQENGPRINQVIFRNVNTYRVGRQAWFFTGLPAAAVAGCENCWHDPLGSERPDDFAYSFWPPPTIIDNAATWNGESSITADVRILRGQPPAGDFAPADKIGLQYDPRFFQP